jgi:hypothetical protein
MTHILLLNVVFFAPSACGASAFAYVVYKVLRSGPPPSAPPEGGSKTPLPVVGPDDLARSA